MKRSLFTGFLLYSLQGFSQISPIAPTVVNAGGGTAAITTNFLVDWSICESTIIETFSGYNAVSNPAVGRNWHVTSGILQPFDNSHLIYSFLVRSWTNEEIHFYPIPTPNTVFIDFKYITRGKITIQVFGQDGKIIGIKEFNQAGNSTQSWNLSRQPSGIYYFRIILQSDQGIIMKDGTFKVEKSK